MTERTCALRDTDGPCGPVWRRDLCKKHYTRWQRHGDPLTRLKRPQGGQLAELQSAAVTAAEECVILTGSVQRPTALYEGRKMLASRVVWILANGDPGEAHVLHRCHRGEEGCINIRHLYLGDNDQNIRDMVNAGNSTRGQRDVNAKLDAQQVRQIRTLIAQRVPYAAIAERYGVSASAIYQISAGKTWAWLTAGTE